MYTAKHKHIKMQFPTKVMLKCVNKMILLAGCFLLLCNIIRYKLNHPKFRTAKAYPHNKLQNL